MDLSDVKAAVSDVNPYYADLLTWEQQHGIIKAIPKKRLSDSAHRAILKTFQKLGGNYVSHAGQAWFELVILEGSGSKHQSSCRTPQGNPHVSLPAAREPCLIQIEARIASLVRAGQTLLEE